MRQLAEASLQRLGTDYIDLYQCHWPDETGTPVEETIGALLELQDAGKIRCFGVSNFPTGLMEACLRCGRIVSSQSPYNALRRDIERDIVPFCRTHDLGILAYSPLAQGLLTGKVTLDRQFPQTDGRSRNRWFSPENRRRVLDMLEKVRPIADGHRATLAQVMLYWTLSQPGITTVIGGPHVTFLPEECTTGGGERGRGGPGSERRRTGHHPRGGGGDGGARLKYEDYAARISEGAIGGTGRDHAGA